MTKQMTWKPFPENIPELDDDGCSDMLLVSFSNFSLLMIGQYREDANGGAWYVGDSDETFAEDDVYVNAFMPLPERYQEEQPNVSENPTGDCLSRQAVLDMCNRIEPTFKGSLLEQGVKSLPSVKPKNDENGFNDSENGENEAVRTTDDFISRQAAIDEICTAWTIDDLDNLTEAMLVDMIKALPSVSPVRPKGHWTHDGSHWKNRFICSECDYKLIDEPTKYCPSCGADMGGDNNG